MKEYSVDAHSNWFDQELEDYLNEKAKLGWRIAHVTRDEIEHHNAIRDEVIYYFIWEREKEIDRKLKLFGCRDCSETFYTYDQAGLHIMQQHTEATKPISIE